MTKLILEYLEIHAGFEYILQTKTFYRTLQTTLTEVAYTQYHTFLTTADKFPASPTLLQRYVEFLKHPLDPTILFPEPTVLIFNHLSTTIPLCIPCSTLHANPKATEAKLADYFHAHPSRYAYDRISQVEACRPRPRCSLPLVYDPRQTILHLYPMVEHHHPNFRLPIHLPVVLLFWMDGIFQRILNHTEQVRTWSGGTGMIINGFSNITWWSVDSLWIFETCFAEDGVMIQIRVMNRNLIKQCVFRTVDRGMSYKLISQRVAPDFRYTHMVPFYYPRNTENPTEPVPTGKSTDMDKKKQFCHCCNIV